VQLYLEMLVSLLQLLQFADCNGREWFAKFYRQVDMLFFYFIFVCLTQHHVFFIDHAGLIVDVSLGAEVSSLCKFTSLKSQPFSIGAVPR
jgi:hypothetical protein